MKINYENQILEELENPLLQINEFAPDTGEKGRWFAEIFPSPYRTTHQGKPVSIYLGDALWLWFEPYYNEDESNWQLITPPQPTWTERRVTHWWSAGARDFFGDRCDYPFEGGKSGIRPDNQSKEYREVRQIMFDVCPNGFFMYTGTLEATETKPMTTYWILSGLTRFNSMLCILRKDTD